MDGQAWNTLVGAVDDDFTARRGLQTESDGSSPTGLPLTSSPHARKGFEPEAGIEPAT